MRGYAADFSAGGPWPTPWMDRVLAVVAELASRHPERTVFTRFIPPERPDQMPGMWQRYYTKWRVATRECLDFRLPRAEAAWCPGWMEQYCVLSRDGVRFVAWTKPCFAGKEDLRILHRGLAMG